MSLPHLTVIAGCNGSGKSSFSKAVTTLNTPSFDYDKVFLKKYKSLIDSDLRVRMAHNLTWTEFENAINEAISLGIDFTYETNFNADPLHWPSFFKEHNYHLRLIFFCLNSIDEAKRRVQIRVENGGHYVPDEEIVSRYYSGFENLDKHWRFFNEVHLFETSSYNKLPEYLFSLLDDEITAPKTIPEYLRNLIPSISEMA